MQKWLPLNYSFDRIQNDQQQQQRHLFIPQKNKR